MLPFEKVVEVSFGSVVDLVVLFKVVLFFTAFVDVVTTGSITGILSSSTVNFFD